MRGPSGARRKRLTTLLQNPLFISHIIVKSQHVLRRFVYNPTLFTESHLFPDIKAFFKRLTARRVRPPVKLWFLAESDGPQNYEFECPCTEAEALAYLRENYQNATVDKIDRDWGVIFYRIGRANRSNS